MSEPWAGRHSTDVPESLIREQVDRIVSNPLFQRSDRLSRFLSYVVDQSLGGKAADLKEQVLAAELYARGDSFDPASDPIVRVDARRLRDKLREYYAESRSDPVLITLPKGSYAPRYEWNTPAVTEAPRGAPSRWWQALLVAALLTAATVASVWTTRIRETPPVRLIPLTSYPGGEYGPALSPDGNFVAFSRTPPGPPGPPDIYVKAVENEAFDRVTETPVGEYSPAWSPDGKEIAFVRALRSKEMGIFITARLGGAERKVSDTGSMVSWTPGARSVVIRDTVGDEAPSLFRIDLETSERRRLTHPPAGFGDWRFDVSPDGKRLAFIRRDHAGVGSIYTVGMDGGEARRLTEPRGDLRDVGWMPGGRELIFSGPIGGIDRLWRVPADLSRKASLIPDIPMTAGDFSISRPGPPQGARLAFVTMRRNISIRRIDLQSAVKGALSTDLPFSETTRVDWPCAFSTDGTKVAFASNRSTPNPELWIANSDGRAARQLTFLASTEIGGCSWSPDGNKIVFSAVVNNNSDLYIVPAEGSNPVRLTASPAAEDLPEWSHDSRWIYYTAHIEGSLQNIWRIPAAGGPAHQVTRDGGIEPKESPNGRDLFYIDRPPAWPGGSQIPSRLMRMPLEGGEAVLVHDRVPPYYWSLTDQGVVFLSLAELTPAERRSRQLDLIRVDAIEQYRFSDRKIVRLGTLPFRLSAVPGRFVVSPDGRWALASVDADTEVDLMLLDGLQ